MFCIHVHVRMRNWAGSLYVHVLFLIMTLFGCCGACYLLYHARFTNPQPLHMYNFGAASAARHCHDQLEHQCTFVQHIA